MAGRDGRVQAGGDAADHARLGEAEQQLDDLLGPGLIDEIAGQATLTGKVKGKGRRAITAAVTIRASLLIALMPEADCGEIMSDPQGHRGHAARDLTPQAAHPDMSPP